MSRAERARDTLDASLRAAGIEGFSSEATPFDRVIVRFDSATDAYLASTRVAFLLAHKETADAAAGEGEPEHYERIDGPVVGSDWAANHEDPARATKLVVDRRTGPRTWGAAGHEETGRRGGW